MSSAHENFARELDRSAQRSMRERVKGVWLVRVRWAALAALCAVASLALLVLGLDTNLAWLAGILVLGASSNLMLHALVRRDGGYCAAVGGVAISLDVVLLAVLLYLYGGYTNPFSMVFLVYVALAAFFLNSRWTWWIFCFSSVLFIGLFFFHVPVQQLALHGHHGATEGFSLHLHGMLVAFLVIGLITSFFLTRLSRELEFQTARLELLSEREQERKRLMSLATLTAGAAHELATPIATLTLVVDDLARSLSARTDVADDLAIMREELRRCEQVLGSMRAQNSELAGEAPCRLTISDIVAGVRDNLKGACARVDFEITGAGDHSVRTLPSTLQSSLAALVRNALQASPGEQRVAVKAQGVAEGIVFTVTDRGIGMRAEVLERVGDPFFTTKDPGQGLGLGIFLVKCFASQIGGEFSLWSREGEGSKASLFIPREVAL